MTTLRNEGKRKAVPIELNRTQVRVLMMLTKEKLAIGSTSPGHLAAGGERSALKKASEILRRAYFAKAQQ